MPAKSAPMHAEYVRLIAERDILLTELRGHWQAARCPAEARPWMDKINHALDERMRLMRCRDTAKATNL